jgi:regulator of sirC expression with transglutaminase-like and TPR domain
MELETPHIRLDCAALHLARDNFPGLNVASYLQRLDDLAGRVAELRPGLAANLRYQAMRQVLCEEFGLTGNRDDYYDPDNCYLNRVLEEREGIPITLSVVWIEVARRLKWPVSGVALPGHFIVRFDDSERYILVDPFYDGRTLSLADCRKLVRRRFGGKMPFQKRFLRRIKARGILARLLRNLRNVYLVADDLPRVARVLQRMIVLEPRNGKHLQDLAAISARLGDMRAACLHLQEYLYRLPNGRDSEHVRHNLRQLQATMVTMN